MGIIIGVVGVLAVIIIMGNGKRVERGEITEEESSKLSASNIAHGLASGMSEVNSFSDTLNKKLDVKATLQKYRHGVTYIDLIMNNMKTNAVGPSNPFNNDIDTASSDAVKATFEVNYEDSCKLITALPKEEQQRYQAELDTAHKKREAKLAELKTLLQNRDYLPAFHAANKRYGSERLVELLHLK